jgi:amino-acid N-acetyltransferase
MSTDPHSVRPAGFEDAEAIVGLIRAHPRELLPRPISEIVQNIDRFLVCEADGRIVGTISWQILPEIGAPTSPSVEIKSLAVSEDRKGAGIGDALVRRAMDHIRSLHPSQLVVLTFVPDFFRKFGFEQVPKEQLMHKIYMGCINCTKYDSPFTCPETAMTLELPTRK